MVDYDPNNPGRFVQLMQSEEVTKDAVQILNDTLERELKQAKTNNASMSASLTALDKEYAKVVKERDELKAKLEDKGETSENGDTPKKKTRKKPAEQEA